MGTRALEDHFDVGDVLGQGGFSVVRRATAKSAAANPRHAAVKTLDKTGRYSAGDSLALLRNEINVMALIVDKVHTPERHPNVLSLIDVFDDRQHVHLVVDLCEGGELFERIINAGKFSEVDAAAVVRQVASGLHALHGCGVVHRDLKPENLLYDTPHHDATLKIMDFGLSHIEGSADVMATSVFGSLDYIAPEVLVRRQFGKPADLWSLGVIMYILLCGYTPFYGADPQAKCAAIAGGNFFFPKSDWDHVSSQAKDLIRRLIVVNPDQRMTAASVLTHPWLESAPDARLPAHTLDALKRTHARRKFRAVAYACLLGSNPRLHRSVSEILRTIGTTDFSQAELDTIVKTFKEVSGHRACVVNQAQFAMVMGKVLNVPADACPQLFALFDVDHDGVVDFRELVVGLAALRNTSPTPENLQRFFHLYDIDDSGDISRHEFALMMSALCDESVLSKKVVGAEMMGAEMMGAEMFADIFERIDANGDDMITFDEFRTALEREPDLFAKLTGRAKRLSIAEPFVAKDPEVGPQVLTRDDSDALMADVRPTDV